MAMTTSDIISSVSATVTVFAVVFAGLQWIDARQQGNLSMKPLVNFYIQDDDTDPKAKVGLAIENNGPGPAIIKSVSYFVDRKPVKDADEALRYGKLNPDHDHGDQFDDDDALASGRIIWLIDYQTKDKKEMARFIDFLDEHLALEISYCSVKDECARKCSDKRRC
ncbi:MAG TPA: hypothetical protein VNT30_20160 [Stellaceae bacterium]|nr:hypothetical protein [Stellaceae bacterium]